MFVGAFFRTRNILTHLHISFRTRNIHMPVYLCERQHRAQEKVKHRFTFDCSLATEGPPFVNIMY